METKEILYKAALIKGYYINSDNKILAGLYTSKEDEIIYYNGQKIKSVFKNGNYFRNTNDKILCDILITESVKNLIVSEDLVNRDLGIEIMINDYIKQTNDNNFFNANIL